MQAEAQGEIPTPSVSPRRRRGFTMILLIFLLLLGSVALIFRQQATSTTHSLPTTIHWQEVWHQYFATLLVAAPSDPTMLYACAFLPSFLRSTDAGAHWQQLQAARGNSGNCSITVNPSQAKDLYASSLASLDSALLEHSSDGGQTWTTIRATLTMPDGQHVPWAGGRLSFIGNHLFAIQDVQNTWHVISSTDGGHTWTVIDAEIIGPHQGIHSYAVDPTNSNIIYELVGAIVIGHFSYAPSGATPTPVPSPIPPDQLILHLYKTTDGGRSWRTLLSSVPSGSSLQLASANHDLLYIGGLTGSSGPSSSHIFHLQWSTNGGQSWQPIAVPVNVPLSNNWFVGASGLLYDTTSSPDSSHSSNTKTLAGSIQRYNPSTHQWSTLAQPSSASAGGLLTVTSAAPHGGDVLWFTNLDNALYRGTL